MTHPLHDAPDGDGPTPFAEAAARVAAGADARAEAAALVAQMTDVEQRWCLDGDQPFWAGLTEMGQGGYHRRPFPAAQVPRLGIGGFRFSDGPRGVVVGPATAYPVSMARGATWDPDLEERIGEAIGVELRAIGATLYGGVCVNVLRHPAWGRAQETYGEDPHHIGEMAAALTRGVQRHAMACVKHLACNSMENMRFSVDVAVDPEVLREVFLPHFRRVVDEGVACVMSAYNAVDGEWCGQHRELLTDVLRDEWGFEGFVISDWIFGLRDAGASVRAGLDVEMPYRMIRAFGLDDAIAEGSCTVDEVRGCVERVVATLLRFHQVVSQPRPSLDVLASPAHRALAREAAAAAIVLLRNEPVGDGGPLLPLDAGLLGRVAVLGELADRRNLGDGGSSDVWAPEVVTPLAGLAEALGGDRVVHHPTDASIAADADVAVVVVGYTKADEGEFIGGSGTKHLRSLMPDVDEPDVVAAFEAAGPAETIPADPPAEAGTDGLGFSEGGDRASLRLRPGDEDLIRATVRANPRTVVCVVAGSAVVTAGWDEQVPALAQSWYAGCEGGRALADVLLGRVPVGGRLPFTVPTDEAHLPPFDRDAEAVTYDAWHGYWRLARDGRTPAYPFGFGLSYGDPVLTGATAAAGGGAGEVVVSAAVANRGTATAIEVVQVYAAGFPAGAERLVGFARAELAPGEERTISVSVVPRAGVDELVVARHAGDPDAIRVALPG